MAETRRSANCFGSRSIFPPFALRARHCGRLELTNALRCYLPEIRIDIPSVDIGRLRAQQGVANRSVGFPPPLWTLSRHKAAVTRGIRGIRLNRLDLSRSGSDG